MTRTADLLRQSRNEHQKARKALAAKLPAAEYLRAALDLRLEARKEDPTRSDPEWLNDALAPPRRGVTGKQYHRIPGLTLAEVAALKDGELERHYREQTGEIVVERQRVENPEIVTPKQWVVSKASAEPCAQAHVFQLLTFDQRRCSACGQVEELRETMAAEDTEAFKQHQREREARR